MAVTLEDVGRHCGVSRSTVSRVINDSPLVNRATKERVLKAIKELSYAPNFIARSLTTNRTETLAVTLPDITGGVFPEILAGMDEIASQRGYHLLVVFLGGARPQSAVVEQLVLHRRVDAVVTVAGTVDDKMLMRMADAQLPVVCCAQKSPVPDAIPSVLFDNAGGAREATKLLISQGHRKLIHIRGPRGNYDAEERSRGFQEALKEARIPYDAKREVDGDFRQDQGARVMKDVLNGGMAFDGLFASNDEMAIGAIEELKRRGRNVPKEIPVVGFDDIGSARFVGLTTVHVSTREMGRVATQLAFDLIDGKKPSGPQILPTEIIERASTATGIDAETIRLDGI